jgi:K+-transporting ATPase ATPase C chain
MKSFITELRSALMSTLILAAVCCGLYPLLVWGIGQAFFSRQANGSLIVDASGVTRGSDLIGQTFTGEKYYHSRPSAAGNGYDAANSGGSNLGPTSKSLNDSIKDRIAAYRSENGLKETDPVPADAVTASGSGLDPHISLRNAQLQTPRLARVRGLTEARLYAVIKQCTDAPSLGIFGEPGVNVLKLNLALDALQ